MKSRLFFIFLFLAQFILAQTSENIELIYEYNRGDERYSGSWSYVDEEEREYALIGAKSGTAVYLLEENNPIEIGFIPGPSSNWREITVLGDYAYVVTEGWEGDLGMQIIDLSSAPDSIALVNTIDQYFGTAHIIQKSIFEESPYIYVAGADVLSGVTIFDCSDPVNPTFVNYYSPGHYVHDIHIRDTLLFTAGIYDNIISIVSIADPMNPIAINAIEDPGNMTHSFSTSPDMNYLFVADEDDGYPMRTFDISDLLNIEEVNTYTANEESLVHNPYTNGIFTYVSHNTEGLRVLDSRDPELLHEVGFYDTFEGPSGGYFGLWSACPYLPSGRIIGADRTRGLMLWSFNGTQAARFYAEIVDANTGEIINTASFLNDTNEELADQGEVKWVGDAGSYNFTVNATGYQSQDLDLDLEEGDSIALTIEMSLLSSTKKVKQEELRIFPNPSSDGIININTGQNTRFISVKDLNGKIVKSIKTDGNSILKITLNSGQYIISCYDNFNNLIKNEELIIY